MKSFSLIIGIFSLFASFSCQAQETKQTEEKQILAFADSVVKWIEKKDIKTLQSRTGKLIDCYACSEEFTKNYEGYKLPAADFYKEEFKRLFGADLLTRLKRNKTIYVKQPEEKNLHVVYYTIFNKDEAAPGHEGGQFGIWVTKENGQYKIYGFDTIP